MRRNGGREMTANTVSATKRLAVKPGSRVSPSPHTNREKQELSSYHKPGTGVRWTGRNHAMPPGHWGEFDRYLGASSKRNRPLDMRGTGHRVTGATSPLCQDRGHRRTPKPSAVHGLPRACDCIYPCPLSLDHLS